MADSLTKKTYILVLVAIVLTLFSITFVVNVFALPSGGEYPPVFTYRQGMWYDAWNITRNAWYGEAGYLPQLANESLGVNRELAYGWGQEFAAEYSDKVERAEEILKFVQRWMKYGYDEDYVTMGGMAQREWAWNADEMAHKIKVAQGSYSVARGDCEDFAFLCSTLYLAADFEVALVGPEGHVALLIWLPEYPNANIYWDIGDGKGYGWIWVEATGDQNLLGWTPPAFNDGRFDVYVLHDLTSLAISDILYEPTKPTPENDITVTVRVTTVEAAIDQVTLIYYVEGALTKNYETMLLIGESTYQATIPKQDAGVTVNFYIQASDTEGREITSYHISFTVTRLLLGIALETLALGIIVVGVIILILALS